MGPLSCLVHSFLPSFLSNFSSCLPLLRSFFLFPRCDARFFNRASYVAEWQNEVSWLFYIESFWSGLPETFSDPLPVWFTRNLKWSHRAKWFRSSGGKVSGGTTGYRRYKRSLYDSGVLFLLTHCSHVYILQSTGDAFNQSSLPSFLSILAHFPEPKSLVTLNRIYFQLRLTSYTSSKEENIPHLRKFA